MPTNTELCTKQSCEFYQQEFCSCSECGAESHSATELCRHCYEREYC